MEPFYCCHDNANTSHRQQQLSRGGTWLYKKSVSLCQKSEQLLSASRFNIRSAPRVLLSAAMANAVQSLPKCLPAEWHASHHVNISSAKQEEAAAERLRAECDRLRRETENTTARVQQTNLHKFSQRIRDIAFWREELEKKVAENAQETELLLAEKQNLEHSLMNTEFPLEVSNLCLHYRTQREQVDLVHDAVEIQLIKV